MRADGDDIRCMATACTLAVVSMNGATFEGRNGTLDKTRLVQCVGVKGGLSVNRSVARSQEYKSDEHMEGYV